MKAEANRETLPPRGMQTMGIYEAGMADIEAENVANPTHRMIRGLKGGPQSADTALWNGQAGRRARGGA